MSAVFLEIVVNAREAEVLGIGSRDELEVHIEEALSARGLGQLTGGGGGGGYYNLDVEVAADRFEEALKFLCCVLRSLGVPKSTQLIRHLPIRTAYRVYGDGM